MESVSQTTSESVAFQLEDLVSYGASGVCRIVALESRNFDGEHAAMYYKLQPAGDDRSCYYVPVSHAGQRMRPLLTREQVYHLIDHEMTLSPQEDSNWCRDNRKRRTQFQSILHSDNYPDLIAMMRSLHQQEALCKQKGKKLSNADEAIMHAAEKRMLQEFSIVLELKPEQVHGLIQKRLQATTQNGVV